MTHQSGSAGLNAASPPLSSGPRFPAQIGRISAIQARMARAALGRSQGDVAMATGCAISTVYLLETRADAVSKKNAGVIRRYYEDLGVSFIADAYGHVVRLAK